MPAQESNPISEVPALDAAPRNIATNSQPALRLAGLRALRDLCGGLLRCIYPPVCLACRTPSETTGVCEKCRDELCEYAHVPLCPRCAATVGPHTWLDDGCPLCSKTVFAFKRVIRLGSYHGLLRNVCLGMKEFGGHVIASTLADLLVDLRLDELKSLNADLVVPVPLHWIRRYWRGYDQAELLAERLAERLGLPMVNHRLVRRLHTKSQATLKPTARKENMRRAFRAKNWSKWKGAHVVLVDDVMTTGSTCHQAASALRQAGVRRIDVVVIARGEAAK